MQHQKMAKSKKKDRTSQLKDENNRWLLYIVTGMVVLVVAMVMHHHHHHDPPSNDPSFQDPNNIPTTTTTTTTPTSTATTKKTTTTTSTTFTTTTIPTTTTTTTTTATTTATTTTTPPTTTTTQTTIKTITTTTSTTKPTHTTVTTTTRTGSQPPEDGLGSQNDDDDDVYGGDSFSNYDDDGDYDGDGDFVDDHHFSNNDNGGYADNGDDDDNGGYADKYDGGSEVNEGGRGEGWDESDQHGGKVDERVEVGEGGSDEDWGEDENDADDSDDGGDSDKKESLQDEVERRLEKKLKEVHRRLAQGAEQTLIYYDSILQLKPTDQVALYGKMLAMEGSEEAVDLCFQAISQPPLSLAFTYNLTQECLDLVLNHKGGDERLAEEVMEGLLEMFPEEKVSFVALSRRLLQQGHWQVGRSSLMMFLERHPSSPTAKVLLAYVLKVLDDDLEGAVQLLMPLVQAADDVSVYVELGDALMRLGRELEAKHVYSRGVEKGVMTSRWQHHTRHVEGLVNRVWWKRGEIRREVRGGLHALERSLEEVLMEVSERHGHIGELYEHSDRRVYVEAGVLHNVPLFSFGLINTTTCSLFPVTCKLLQQIPDVTQCQQCRTSLLFMAPSTTISTHSSSTNAIITIFIPISLHHNDKLSVREEVRAWRDGILLFDPSFHTRVMVAGEDEEEEEIGQEEVVERVLPSLPGGWRAVLSVQVWHPDVSESLAQQLPSLSSASWL